MQDDHYQRKECATQFERIWEELDDKGKKITEHGEDITGLKTNMVNLVKSMDKLTGAIWGMVGTVIALLVGFVLWYIQSLPR